MSSFGVDALRKRLIKAPVADGPDHYRLDPLVSNIALARLATGELAVIVIVDERARTSTLEYGGLRLETRDDAEVRIGSKVQDAALSVISCTDASLHHNFCILVADLASSSLREPASLRTAAQVKQFVNEWAELFARRRQLSDAEEIGLWGELEILALLPNVERGVAVWHGPEAGRFDFGGSDELIEVKTSVGKHEHYFSLEQLKPPSSKSRLLVASLTLSADPASGQSIDDQVQRVRKRLSATLDFDRRLARLGYRSGASTRTYSLREALFFHGRDVPRPRQLDRGVSEVTFFASLIGKKPVRATTVSAALAHLVG